jgi:hypothetical protein
MEEEFAGVVNGKRRKTKRGRSGSKNMDTARAKLPLGQMRNEGEHEEKQWVVMNDGETHSGK